MLLTMEWLITLVFITCELQAPHIFLSITQVPLAMATELVAHMRLSHYKGLWQALYGSTHGLGERKLKLNLTSAQRGCVVELPVVCRYDDNIAILSTRGVSKSEWSTFCKLNNNYNLQYIPPKYPADVYVIH